MKNWKIKLLAVVALLGIIAGMKVYERTREYERAKISSYILTNNCFLEPVMNLEEPKRYQCNTGHFSEMELTHAALEAPDDVKE